MGPRPRNTSRRFAGCTRDAVGAAAVLLAMLQLPAVDAGTNRYRSRAACVGREGLADAFDAVSDYILANRCPELSDPANGANSCHSGHYTRTAGGWSNAVPLTGIATGMTVSFWAKHRSGSSYGEMWGQANAINIGYYSGTQHTSRPGVSGCMWPPGPGDHVGLMPGGDVWTHVVMVYRVGEGQGNCSIFLNPYVHDGNVHGNPSDGHGDGSCVLGSDNAYDCNDGDADHDFGNRGGQEPMDKFPAFWPGIGCRTYNNGFGRNALLDPARPGAQFAKPGCYLPFEGDIKMFYLWKRALNDAELAGLHNASSSDAAVPFCPMKPSPPAPSCVGRAGLAQAYPVYPPFNDRCDAIADPFDTNVCTRADYGSAVRSDGYAMKTGSQFRTRTGTDGQDGFSYSFWARYGDFSGYIEYYGQGGGLNLGMYGTRVNFADSRGYMFGLSGCHIAVRAPPGIHPATRWIRGQWAHIVGVHRGDNCTLTVVPQGEWAQYGDAFVGRITARQAVEGNGGESTLGFRPAIGCRGHHTGDVCEGGNSQGINAPNHGKMTQHYSWKRALEDAEVATLLKPAYGNDAAPNLDQHGTPRACTTHCGRWINGGSGGEHPMFEDCMYMPPDSGGRDGGGTGQEGAGHIYVFGHDLLCCPEGWAVTGGNAAVAGVTGICAPLDGGSGRCHLYGGPLPWNGWTRSSGNSWDGICDPDDTRMCPSVKRLVCPPQDLVPDWCPLQTAPPSQTPSNPPTAEPTAHPTAGPSTTEPTPSPTAVPTALPTALPTGSPTTGMPTASPTSMPISSPTASPSDTPSVAPTVEVTDTAGGNGGGGSDSGTGGDDYGDSGTTLVVVLAVALVLTAGACFALGRRQQGGGPDGNGGRGRAMDNALYGQPGTAKTDGFGFPPAKAGDGYLEVATTK